MGGSGEIFSKAAGSGRKWMGEYVSIGELKTWYEQDGKGDPLVLLHGGLCTNDTWAPQIPAFREQFRVLAPERQGHGHTPDLNGPLSYDRMAAHMIGFLETVVAQPAHLVGWSDGGIVGLLIAIARPDLLRKLVVIGTNFDTSGVVPGFEEGLVATPPDAEDIAMLRQLYQASSPDGSEYWPVVFDQFKAMITTGLHIPVSELRRIRARTLVIAGDDDMVSLEHTTELFRAIADAELAVVPGASHLLLMEKPELVNSIIVSFLEQDPSPTMMPIRRAGTPET